MRIIDLIEKKLKAPTASQCAVKRLSNVRYAQCVSRGMKSHDSDHTAGTGKQGVKGSGVHLKGKRAASVKHGGNVKNYGGTHS
jgi:hypothetical protein